MYGWMSIKIDTSWFKTAPSNTFQFMRCTRRIFLLCWPMDPRVSFLVSDFCASAKSFLPVFQIYENSVHIENMSRIIIPHHTVQIIYFWNYSWNLFGISHYWYFNMGSRGRMYYEQVLRPNSFLSRSSITLSLASLLSHHTPSKQLAQAVLLIDQWLEARKIDLILI